MMYDILIFVQAAADLRYALSIYDKNKGKKIYISVVNVKLVYDFICELELVNTTICFYPVIVFQMKNPISYISAKKNMNLVWEKDFLLLDFSEVYFFSRFYDWFTAGIIGKFLKEKKADVIYYEHYDDDSVKNDSFKSILSINYVKALIVSYISSVHFTSRYSIRSLEFEYWKYNIKKISASNLTMVNPDFLYKIKVQKNNSILFLLSPSEIEMIDDLSRSILVEVILSYKSKGFILILKGHPRLGSPTSLEKHFDFIIPSYVPSEFISYQNINFTVGIMSIGLSYITTLPDIKVYSIINLLEFIEPQRKFFYINFLREQCSDRIEFVNDRCFIN